MIKFSPIVSLSGFWCRSRVPYYSFGILLMIPMIAKLQRALHNASLRGANEFYDLVALVGRGELQFDLVEGVGIVEALHINVPIDILDLRNLLIGIAAAPQPYRIDAGVGNRLTGRFGERGYILAYQRTSRYEGMGTDLDELVYRTDSTHNSQAVDVDVPGHL